MTTHAFFDPLGAFAADAPAKRRATAGPRSLCYKDLLGAAWGRLPAATRARFERHEAHLRGHDDVARDDGGPAGGT